MKGFSKEDVDFCSGGVVGHCGAAGCRGGSGRGGIFCCAKHQNE